MPEARQRPKIQLGKGLVTETDANVVTAGLFFHSSFKTGDALETIDETSLQQRIRSCWISNVKKYPDKVLARTLRSTAYKVLQWAPDPQKRWPFHHSRNSVELRFLQVWRNVLCGSFFIFAMEVPSEMMFQLQETPLRHSEPLVI